MLIAFCEISAARKIINRLLSVAHDKQRVWNARPIKRSSHQEDVVFIIFRQQYWYVIKHVLEWLPVLDYAPMCFGIFYNMAYAPHQDKRLHSGMPVPAL